MTDSRLNQSRTGTVDANGNVTVQFPPPDNDWVWQGSLFPTSAPAAATWTITVGGVNWGTYGTSTTTQTAQVQAWAAENVVVVGAGFTPGSRVTFQWLGVEIPLREASHLAPVAVGLTASPAVVTTATAIAVAVGSIDPITDSFSTTAAIGPTSSLVGLVGAFSWSGGAGGPFSRSLNVRLSGNVSGSATITTPLSFYSGGFAVFQFGFSLPLSAPVSLAALLGVATNTVLTVAVINPAPPWPIGGVTAAVNAVLA